MKGHHVPRVMQILAPEGIVRPHSCFCRAIISAEKLLSRNIAVGSPGNSLNRKNMMVRTHHRAIARTPRACEGDTCRYSRHALPCRRGRPDGRPPAVAAVRPSCGVRACTPPIAIGTSREGTRSHSSASDGLFARFQVSDAFECRAGPGWARMPPALENRDVADCREFRGAAQFHDPPAIHHRDAGAEMPHRGEIV